MWGGRFRAPPSPAFRRIGGSLSFDHRLLPYDIRGSIAWAGALNKAGVLSGADHKAIVSGLQKILGQWEKNPGSVASRSNEYEDVHSFVEARLFDIVGEAGRRLHTGRSRNDQVATDFRMYVRDEGLAAGGLITKLLREILKSAQRSGDTTLPAFTHTQHAQPVLLAHFWLAYFEMLKRDAARFSVVTKACDLLPLGSGACSGTGFGVDRNALALKLGFKGISKNSLDAVSDRDFALEYLFAGATLMMHLSRLAEDIILYSSAEFGYFLLHDSVTSGSSLMPQKKNPDAMELVRGKCGRAVGNLERLFVVMKGLPMSYNRDMQEDKEAVFDTADTLRLSLEASIDVVATIDYDRSRMLSAAKTGHTNATECADYLVKKGVPFREAHEAVGRAVLAALENGVSLEDLAIETLTSIHPAFSGNLKTALSVKACIGSRDCLGGTAPARVKKALVEAQKFFGKPERAR